MTVLNNKPYALKMVPHFTLISYITVMQNFILPPAKHDRSNTLISVSFDATASQFRYGEYAESVAVLSGCQARHWINFLWPNSVWMRVRWADMICTVLPQQTYNKQSQNLKFSESCWCRLKFSEMYHAYWYKVNGVSQQFAAAIF